MSEKPKSGEFVLLSKDEYDDLLALLRDVVKTREDESRQIIDIRMTLLRLEQKKIK